jgi:hypothetical protein
MDGDPSLRAATFFPLRAERGEGGDPLLRRSNGEGEVSLRCTSMSVRTTHLTRALRAHPLPPQAGGEGLRRRFPTSPLVPSEQ